MSVHPHDVRQARRRPSAVPAREIVVSLPYELDPALALRYARELADKYGPVDVAVHLPTENLRHEVEGLEDQA